MYIWGWDFGMRGIRARGGKWEVSLRVTWERGGRILSQQGGFQVSGGGLEWGARGDNKARGMRHVHCNLCSCI
jgi:hypothetical protein